MTTKRTISYDDTLDNAIDLLVGRGYYESRSDFFREAAAHHIAGLREDVHRANKLTEEAEADLETVQLDYEQAVNKVLHE